MRQSNASLVAKALDNAADDLLSVVFTCLKENNITVGLKLKRLILERVSAKLDEIGTSGNGNGNGEAE